MATILLTDDMNVYDFDGTIYSGDSSLDFYLFCLRRDPSLVRFLPIQVSGVLSYMFRLSSKTIGKEAFFSFLRGVPDLENAVEDFWCRHTSRIQSWYLNQKAPDDVVISASPEFLLSTLCRQLRITLIASHVDVRTGRFLSENCYGEEKLRRFKEVFPSVKIGAFYSDSETDIPMTTLASKSYKVKKGRIYEWNR